MPGSGRSWVILWLGLGKHCLAVCVSQPECAKSVCFCLCAEAQSLLVAGGDLQMAELGSDVEEGRKLLSKRAERMRRPSARSFLDYQDEDGSDSDGSLGEPTTCNS